MGLIPGQVTAVIVTRGDCDLTPIRESLIFDDVIVWDNTKEQRDYGAFGRYQAIFTYITAPVIYVQDDDCIVSPDDQRRLLATYQPGVLAALMPRTRTDYPDTVLIGWGALFDRHLPFSAFRRWKWDYDVGMDREFLVVGADFVFPMLTPHVRLDALHEDLPHAHADNRTWASWPDYASVKERYLREARAIRDRAR